MREKQSGFKLGSIPTLLIRMFGILSFLWPSNEQSPDYLIDGKEIGGVGALSQALAARAVDNYTPKIEFGEPRLVDRAHGPITDLYVVIPTVTPKGEPNPANVEFPLPDDPDDIENELNQFLDAVGVGSLDEVQGEIVDSVREGGVLKPVVDVIDNMTSEPDGSNSEVKN